MELPFLHSGKRNAQVQLYAFDILARGGEDLRPLPLELRKTNLAQLLRGRPDGIFIAPSEVGEIGPELFHGACSTGLEGLVSKHRQSRYRGGRQPAFKPWVFVVVASGTAIAAARKEAPPPPSRKLGEGILIECTAFVPTR